MTPLGDSSAARPSDQVRRKDLLAEYTASIGVGAAPANEPMFRIRPFLLMMGETQSPSAERMYQHVPS
jgi:hypothetical protein